ncbi:hypothetical protein [Isoptericola sp. BMS4]|uniref:hypothetical protein n=1 Tax=Isoptericola sp. BMS4 TaxID=2527875 RepID=UPI001420520A|nr:hypothetical protein [Isoptericola sp. BMS4]
MQSATWGAGGRPRGRPRWTRATSLVVAMGVAGTMVGPTGAMPAAGLETTQVIRSHGAVAHQVPADPHVDRPGPEKRPDGRPAPGEGRRDRSERPGEHAPRPGPETTDKTTDETRVVDAASPVPAGGASRIRSSGWRPKADVSLSLVGPDGGPVGGAVAVTANAEGRVTGHVTVPVPAGAAAGAYTVVGTDEDGGSATARIDVYAPSLEATSPVPAAGRTGIASGGWRAASDVTLRLADLDGNPAGDPTTVTTDEDGDVPAGTVLAVPAVPAGTTLTVVARDDAGARVTDEVTVIAANDPVVDVSSPVPAGGEIPVTSSGWPGETDLVLRLADAAGAAAGDPVTVTTDADGTVPAGTTVPVPAGTVAGVHTLTAADGAGRTVSDELRVYAPSLEVEPSDDPDACARVASSGWLPRSEVTLRATSTDGARQGAPTTATADEDGTLTDVCAPVPDDVPRDDVTVVAVDDEGGRATTTPAADPMSGTPARTVGAGLEVGDGARSAGTPVAVLTLVVDAATLVAARLASLFPTG